MGTIVDVSGLPTVITDGMAGHDANHETIHKALQSYATVATTGLYSDLAGVPAFELRGTGFPEGVVTALPGTYYTDTAGTNGAWRWLKTSGTGNTGWIVMVGDTGRRDVTALFSTALPGPAGTILMARTPNHVEIDIFLTGSLTGTWNNAQVPTGFTPTEYGSGYWRELITIPNVDGPGLSTSYYRFNQSMSMFMTFSAIPAASSKIFRCTDPWPSTLPGVPA